MIEGTAGIGKTCLLAACRERADELGMTVLRVRGDELVVESSFAAVRELLWTELQARPKPLARAARLAVSVFERGSPGRVDRDHAAAVLYGLYWLVADLADRAPLALLIDDAHWLDAAAAERIDHAGLLGDGDEVARRYDLAGAVAPSDQRLEADQLECGQAVDGLVLEEERLLLEAAAQVRRGR